MPKAMRLSELSARSGVPIPTIKFYLRERLLPPGTSTAPNQAAYGPQHLLWLRLIRVLTGIGQLSIAALRKVLQALDDPAVPTRELYGVLARGRESRPSTAESPAPGAARAQVDAVLASRGWQIEPDDAQRDRLAHAVALLDGVDLDALAATADQSGAQLLDLFPDYKTQSSAGPFDRALLVARLAALDAAYDVLRRLAVEQHHLTIRAPQTTSAKP